MGPHPTLGEGSAIKIVFNGWETEARDDTPKFSEGVYGTAST